MNTPRDRDLHLDGTNDLVRAVDRLGRRLPEPLYPLAQIAYNYSWSWTPVAVSSSRGWARTGSI